MLEKISSAQVEGLMIKAASALRSLEAENIELKTELARRDRKDHAEKIASQAVDRGIMEEDEALNYANDLANGAENLDLVEDFVSRAAAGVPLGKTLEKVASDITGGDGEVDVLTAFLQSSDYAG